MSLGKKKCTTFGSTNMILNACLFILSVQFGSALCSWQDVQQRSGIQVKNLDGDTLAQLLGEPDIAHVRRSASGSKNQCCILTCLFITLFSSGSLDERDWGYGAIKRQLLSQNLYWVCKFTVLVSTLRTPFSPELRHDWNLMLGCSACLKPLGVIANFVSLTQRSDQ